MRGIGWIALAAALALAGCSDPEKRAAIPAPLPAAAPPEGARITQYYATKAQVARGETALVCYGVENARTVWLEPPRHELSAAMARCVEVSPTANTTYKLSVQGADGKTVTRELTVKAGAARARLVSVKVSALEVRAGDLVSLCFTAENARAVTVDPIGFRAANTTEGCATDQPVRPTAYTISAVGADGEKDQERVTVQVK
jgi:hypothetical protein